VKVIALLLLAMTLGQGRTTVRPAAVVFPGPSASRLAGEIYGAGDRGVVIIAHGGYSTLASWRDQASSLGGEGFRVLVFESRAAVEFAAGQESPCMYDAPCQAADVLAAVRYLRQNGARTVATIGGSMGGGAVAQAAVDARPGEIDRIVLLAPAEIAAPEKMQGRKLFITTREDANDAGLRLPGIQRQYDRCPGPKQLIVLGGSAHAQRIFATEQGEEALREIVRFLTQG
jgi:pimeloyl-ACP methyl ester carboxylesterase